MFEIGEQYYDDEDEEFAYTSFVQYSNEEMLDMLNMNDFSDDESDNQEENVLLHGISFAKLKKKMISLTADQKVNQLLFFANYFFLIEIK